MPSGIQFILLPYLCVHTYMGTFNQIFICYIRTECQALFRGIKESASLTPALAHSAPQIELKVVKRAVALVSCVFQELFSLW